MIARVADLVRSGIVEVLTTDLTTTEVSKKHAANDFDVISNLARSHVRQLVQDHLGVTVPKTNKDELRKRIAGAYGKKVAAMFETLKARTLSIDAVKPSDVFSSYSDGRGFFAGEGKKDQFPDAFIFECLTKEASAQAPLIVVSDDGDFRCPVQSNAHMTLLKSIPDLFEHLGLGIDEVEIDAFLGDAGVEADLRRHVDQEVEQWSFIVTDVEDAEIDQMSVTIVKLSSLTSFGPPKKGGSILVVGDVEVTADASYTHPDWDHAAYDSEDKVLIPFGDVSGESVVTIDGQFSMSIAVASDGAPAKISEFRFRGERFLCISLHESDY